MKRFSKLIAAVIGIIPVALVAFGVIDESQSQQVAVLVSSIVTPVLTFFAPANAS